MAIPVHLQNFKAAGIYRVVFDKSTILNVDTEILRLVVGYSEQGPFNTPVYVKSTADFKLLFGDISKKLEKRGIYFHRLALQCLANGPILCLNLKKFDGETVDGATIDSSFDAKTPIDTVKLNVEDIYDTTRFWTLDATKLPSIKAIDNTSLAQKYINICTTNTIKTSGTYFIRKASGTKVSGYNLTINSWYSDGAQEMPEYLENFKQHLVSDFFAEIYVFKGKFNPKQVLASETLKNYFEVNENGELQLKPYVTDAFGDIVDTLDALYQDETSGAVGHYIGSLIPYFKNKQGAYASLDVLFNSDIDVHNMMMSFNSDLLDESGSAQIIDLSGRIDIPANNEVLESIQAGTYKTNLLGNLKSTVVSDTITFKTNVFKNDEEIENYSPIITNTKIIGNFAAKEDGDNIILTDIYDSTSITIKNVTNLDKFKNAIYDGTIDISNIDALPSAIIKNISRIEGEITIDVIGTDISVVSEALTSAGIDNEVIDEQIKVTGDVNKAITIIKDLDGVGNITYSINFNDNLKVNFDDVELESVSSFTNNNAVYGSSISFISVENWESGKITVDGVEYWALYATDTKDTSVATIIQAGDYILAADNTVDTKESFFDNVIVQNIEINTSFIVDGTEHEGSYITLSGEAYSDFDGYVIRIDAPLNQEIGIMGPQYLEGYVYKNENPKGTSMSAKIDWQDLILSTLTVYKGLRVALLNKSEIDYRYVVDTFESFPVSNLKNVLAFLCKEKQSAFCIANFPSVQTFVKCPFTSFTDSKGLFNVEYVVKGFNKKKPAGVKFSIPSDADGASFIAFYTPLKFSDGYMDSIIPSAGLVSNLFMQKYLSRQPYYIVAGPNYGVINAAGLVGPDYKYSMDELQLIEPFGVNCMVYRPNFGTFINANQTAKQIPVSALSKVNVRELVIYLQDEIEKLLQSYQWEFNNQMTRSAILDKANSICELIKSNGGIQAYKNIMDESNNGPDIIDNEMAVLSTHIEPGMGCGKMVHELTIYRTGQMSASISE